MTRATVTASDNCASVTVDATTESTQISDEYPYKLIHTWSTVDQCGNTNSQQQTVTIVDDEDPTFQTQPADQTIACNDTLVLPDIVPLDNCEATLPATVTPVPSVLQQDCPRIEKYYYSVTDTSGKTIDGDLTVTILDIVDPIITVDNQDRIYECTADAAPLATVYDDCDTVALSDNGTVANLQSSDPEVKEYYYR